MEFKFTPTSLPEVLLIETPKISDERGYFMENYKQSQFIASGIKAGFVQDNFSFSQKGVLRGLHYQLPPHAQGKLVRAITGRIWDVAVDIRKSSPTFGKWLGVELSEDNGLALYIPPGFAHGFVVLSESAGVLYKTTAEYHPPSERGIVWNDPKLNIVWPVQTPVLSDKDKKYPVLEKAEAYPESNRI